jgi:monoamine oxidase
LTAAAELERAGWEVAVLEARDRLGGRVHTLRFDSGQHAELGGEFIDTRHTAMIAAVRRHGLELEDVRRGWAGLDDLVFTSGRRMSLARFESGASARQTRRFWSSLYSLMDDVSVQEPGTRRGPELDRISIAEFLDRLRIAGRARFLIESQLRGDYGVEPRDLSLLFTVLSEKVAWDQPGPGVEAFRVRGGNARLVEAIAGGLAEPVAVGASVTEVEHGASWVTVRTAGGDVHEADHCVLAVPLPARRRIAVHPALARPLAAAADQVAYATTTKTVLDCRRRFWRERGFSGDILCDLPLDFAWEATDQQPGRRGALITYAAGADGRAAARLSAQRRVQLAEDGVARVFPGSRPLIDGASTVAWSGERFSGGCWVCYAPGQTVRHWPALNDDPSDGRIHLAGEHTEHLSGYMESAIRSGEAAARRVGSY